MDEVARRVRRIGIERGYHYVSVVARLCCQHPSQGAKSGTLRRQELARDDTPIPGQQAAQDERCGRMRRNSATQRGRLPARADCRIPWRARAPLPGLPASGTGCTPGNRRANTAHTPPRGLTTTEPRPLTRAGFRASVPVRILPAPREIHTMARSANQTNCRPARSTMQLAGNGHRRSESRVRFAHLRMRFL